jgi:hypothetical protein
VLAIIGIIVVYTIRVEFKTIVLDWLDQDVVRIIIVINCRLGDYAGSRVVSVRSVQQHPVFQQRQRPGR